MVRNLGIAAVKMAHFCLTLHPNLPLAQSNILNLYTCSDTRTLSHTNFMFPNPGNQGTCAQMRAAEQ